MMILIIEDDEHKSSQILEILEIELKDKNDRLVIDNVKDAVRFLVNKIPLKIVLDMSLPSHKALPGQGTPVPMPTGGIEVLFELKKKGLTYLPILILTQYPEIEIEEEPIPVSESAKALKETYGFSDINACYYDHIHSSRWKTTTIDFLRRK